MTRTMLPAALGLIFILSLCFYEGYAMKDRWGAVGITAEDLSERFDQVPKNIGEWKGQDLPVDEIVRKTAGAIGYVSRQYTNSSTGQQVVLWLIVGHSRDVVRHQPTACYPSSGFRQAGSEVLHHINIDGGDGKNNKEAVFYTAKFEKEDAFSHRKERVFWTFNHPDKNAWEAPQGVSGARSRYGLARALYKLYFTSNVLPGEETIEDSAAIHFAEVMLPAINKALFPTEEVAEKASSSGSDNSGEALN